jgi:AhpD family alkylhydroperoxidase
MENSALGEETIMSYGKSVRDDLQVLTRELRHAIPDVYAGYQRMREAAFASGAVDTKIKELIALAIAVTRKCDGCIAAHAHGSVLAGATPAEAAETIGVAILMNGGPGMVYGPRAFAAFREFYDTQAEATAAD